MRLFRRRPSVPAAYASVSPGDREVLGSILAEGGDLTQPRDVVHYCYFTLEPAARAAEDELAAAGWAVTVSAPGESIGEWSVVATDADRVLSPETVVIDGELFTAVTARHSGDYDGWEAAV